MNQVKFAIFCFALILSACGTANGEPETTAIAPGKVAALLTSIKRHVAATEKHTGVAALDPAVLRIIGEIPRHEFVPAPLRDLAYLDIPLPLGHEQNLPQPFLVALMTHLAAVERHHVVFETGTGAGYQAAVLARLAKRVYSVEVVRPLAAQAASRLKALKVKSVEIKAADGYYGWPEKGPFDAIIVKEAVHHIPPPLLNQLKRGGRMVIPVGPLDQAQMLKLVTKDKDGRLHQRNILPVRFAPLQGGERI
jgi:protein-L-isoaspartate(D-aspartate) O-methyltransferase